MGNICYKQSSIKRCDEVRLLIFQLELFQQYTVQFLTLQGMGSPVYFFIYSFFKVDKKHEKNICFQLNSYTVINMLININFLI